MRDHLLEMGYSNQLFILVDINTVVNIIYDPPQEHEKYISKFLCLLFSIFLG